MEQPWKGEKWWVSPLNFMSTHIDAGRRIQFHDVTLRDGEQTPGVVLRKEEKLRIARELDAVGVDRIEAGMPVVSKEDFEAVRAIAGDGLQAKVFAFCRVVQQDIDAALRSDVSGIICEGPVGIPKLRQFGWTGEEVTERVLTAIDYAKSHGLYTVFFGVDTTRADLGFLFGLYERLERETKVDALAIVDTFGCATPEGLAYMVSECARRVKLPLEVHCHNDFGLATACTLSAALAGASVLHTSVNGMGERSGNAAFEEVALALRLLYGFGLKLKFERFYLLSKLVEELSGFKTAPNKAVVGEGAFTREAGISVAGWMKYALGSEAYLPELVGNKHGVVIGKKSGRHAIEWKLKQMAIDVPPQLIEHILAQVKSLSEEKKGALTDEEFIRIVEEVKSRWQ